MRNGNWNIWGKLQGKRFQSGLCPDSGEAVTMDIFQIMEIEDEETRVQKIYEVFHEDTG